MNANYTTNKILIDWLSFTCFYTDNVDDVVHLLGLDNIIFAHGTGYQGYEHRLYYGDENGSIHIHYGGKSSVWVDMSGAGCRYFEDFTTLSGGNCWVTLFDIIVNTKISIDRTSGITDFIKSNDDLNSDILDFKCFSINRIDIAYDDFNYLIDLDLIINSIKSHDVIKKFRDFGTVTQSYNSDFSVGTNIAFGSVRSDVYMRCYDKAVERGRQDEISHWVRWEIQLRHNIAYEFIRLLINDNKTIDVMYFLVLNNYIRFVDIKNCETENKSRDAKIFDWWAKFAFSVTSDKASLWVRPGGAYNMKKLVNYVTNMAGGAIFTYCKCFGVDDLFIKVSNIEKSLNPKYKLLLSEYEDYISKCCCHDEIDYFYSEI